MKLARLTEDIQAWNNRVGDVYIQTLQVTIIQWTAVREDCAVAVTVDLCG